MQNFTKFFREAVQSVLPIFAIVLILSVSFAPLESGVLVMFLFGTLLLIVGMGFFTIGSGISMEPLGEGIGATLGKTKRWIIPLLICFGLGLLITIAEPDLTVLAEQVPSIPNMVFSLVNIVKTGVWTKSLRNLNPVTLLIILKKSSHHTWKSERATVESMGELSLSI